MAAGPGRMMSGPIYNIYTYIVVKDVTSIPIKSSTGPRQLCNTTITTTKTG